MARMTLKAVHGDGERRRLPLSERIVDQNLSSYRQILSRARGSDQPQRTQKSSSRDQPTLLTKSSRGVAAGKSERRTAAAGDTSRQPARSGRHTPN
jgi:hypothetical protein